MLISIIFHFKYCIYFAFAIDISQIRNTFLNISLEKKA